MCEYVGQYSCQTNGNLGLGKKVVRLDSERELSGDDDIHIANPRNCANLDV